MEDKEVFNIYEFAKTLINDKYELRTKLTWTISDLKMAIWELQRPSDSVTTYQDRITYALTFLVAALDRAEKR